ncbi:MAG: hypothetical protein AMXMBFR56_81750 [Polyangiaceae bacterium]
MSFRKAHGNAAKATSLVWENTPVDELAPAPAPPTTDKAAGRDGKGRITSSEKAREMARLRHVRPDFVRVEVACTPEFEPFNRRRQELVRQRVAELHAMFGGVSAGIGSMLRAWGWAVAFGEYLAHQAAQTGNPELMEQSGRALARASVELAKAYELAGKEHKARPKPPAPWLLADPQGADDDADDAEPDNGDENASAPNVGGAATESEDT